jgi:hypothetical protein
MTFATWETGLRHAPSFLAQWESTYRDKKEPKHDQDFPCELPIPPAKRTSSLFFFC